jgi:hypothetical protein
VAVSSFFETFLRAADELRRTPLWRSSQKSSSTHSGGYGRYRTPCLKHQRLALNLIHKTNFVKVRFEPLGYLSRLPHVLGCFSVPKHSLKRLWTAPLRVVGDRRTV